MDKMIGRLFALGVILLGLWLTAAMRQADGQAQCERVASYETCFVALR
jgi:hypothetical protein